MKLAIGTDPLTLGVNATVEVHTVLLDMKMLDYSSEVLESDPIEF